MHVIRVGSRGVGGGPAVGGGDPAGVGEAHGWGPLKVEMGKHSREQNVCSV